MRVKTGVRRNRFVPAHASLGMTSDVVLGNKLTFGQRLPNFTYH